MFWIHFLLNRHHTGAVKYTKVKTLLVFYYTPSIYAQGYIVFPFPFVHLFICPSVTFMEFASVFYVKVSPMGISLQPLI